MLRIGLTGGIGAGKSTVSAAFSECGGIIVDGDVIAREVVEPGTEGLAALVDAFGEDILLPDGALNRPALAAKAFVDDEQRANCSMASSTRWWADGAKRSSPPSPMMRWSSRTSHCSSKRGWRRCFRWWWSSTPTRRQGCSG